MARFYLTTAIDYVNSRPHLGTAYEKIARRRHRPLQAARAAFETHFLMGNDEHSQNVFKKAREERARSAGVLRPDGAGVPRGLGAARHLVRRLHPDDRAAPPGRRARSWRRRIYDAGDIYEGVYEGWYCVGCEAFKQEKDLVDGKCPLHPTQARVDPREELLLPAVEVSAAAARSLRRASGVPPAGDPAQRDPAARRRRARGHLDQPRRAVVGHPAARSIPTSVVYVWFDALINYASAVGFGTDAALFEQWWPADLHVIGKDITRFHAVIWPAMLMSAGAAAAAAGLRPRLGALQGPADEQVARHGRRSARGGAIGSAPIRCGCIW